MLMLLSRGTLSLLATVLTEISENGKNALNDVVRFLKSMKTTAESMTGPQGTVRVAADMINNTY
jgi:hypothetical protein